MDTILSLIEGASTASLFFIALVFVMLISNIFLEFEKHSASAIIAFASVVGIAIAFFWISEPHGFWLIVIELVLVIIAIISSIVIAFISMFIKRQERYNSKKRFFKIVLITYYLSLSFLSALSF